MTTKKAPKAQMDRAAEALAALPSIVTAKEASDALRVSRRTLNILVSQGRLTPIKHSSGGTSRLLFYRAELVRYLRGLEVAA